jgi:superfamily I DNA/RNA helicase
VALFRQAADFTEGAPGAQPELFLESVLSADVPDDVIMPTPSWPAVLVATPPGVAGQEFDLVIVSGVEDGVWPDLRLRGSLLAAHRLPAALRGESTDTLD